MTLHLHDYGRTGVGAGGAPINYSEVSRLLLGEPGIDPRPHDFYALLEAGQARPLNRIVRNGDTVVCTVGPYAHLYHYWREHSGLDFRIVRDARTTAWAPYLAQEWLAAPMVRERDLIVFPSEFTRRFYRGVFPHITQANSRVLYPLAGHLPSIESRRSAGAFRIGCLGRIADDKNILDAIAIAARLRRERRCELHLAGPFYPASRRIGSPAALGRAARSAGLPSDSVVYHGNLPYERIWAFLAGVDVLFFPAVSSNESFGRAIAEASHAGIAVVATDYAAAPELLPPGNLVGVRYHDTRQARLSRPLSLGAPDPDRAAAALLSRPEPGDALTDSRFSKTRFLRAVTGEDEPQGVTAPASRGVRHFLDEAQLDGVEPLSPEQAAENCLTQLRFIRLLNHPGLARRLCAVTRLAGHLPGDDVLRRVARERLSGKLSPGVLRNAVASGRFVGFDPRLTLRASDPP